MSASFFKFFLVAHDNVRFFFFSFKCCPHLLQIINPQQDVSAVPVGVFTVVVESISAVFQVSLPVK